MRTTYIMLGAVMVIFAGCQSSSPTIVPNETALISAASLNGRFIATVDRYDTKERIALVSTPNWKPESKPYQFDGKNWIPLWSPYAPLDEE
jgi:hypothetical protein